MTSSSFKCHLFLFWLQILLMADPSRPYIVLVDSYGEECFFEHVLNGTHLRLTFQVVSGGFYDIDVVLADPTATAIYHRRQASYGGHAFIAPLHGRYFFCFHNTHSSKVPKIVMFDFDYYDANLAQELLVAQNDLETMLKKVEVGLKVIKRETEYMAAKTKTHFNINENTNVAILVWALLEYSLIVALCVWQHYYLLKYFEVRRYV